MDVTLEMETKAFRAWTIALIRDLEGKAARQALRVLAFEFLDRVISKTPVDLGRARGGWASYLIAKGKPFVSGAEASAGAEEKLGIDEGSFEEEFSGSEQFILLINAVSYIVLLEFGSSKQAPAGMMRITFNEMRMHRSGQKTLRDEFVKAVERTNRLRRSTAPKWEKVTSMAFA